MDALFIESTQDTPSIILNKNTNTFLIAERSYPEDAFEFYTPILKWVENYKASPNDKTIFEFKLDYFNTTSSKQIFKLMLILEDLSKIKEVEIKWYYKKMDKEMCTHGEIFSKVISLPFEIIEF
jgi:hypothetical protein